MSHWNYRIIRYADGGYGLHEVYYGVDGKDESWTLEPIGFKCEEEEGPAGIVSSLRLALTDAERRPVLQIKQTWAELVDESARCSAI